MHGWLTYDEKRRDNFGMPLEPQVHLPETIAPDQLDLTPQARQQIEQEVKAFFPNAVATAPKDEHDEIQRELLVIALHTVDRDREVAMHLYAAWRKRPAAERAKTVKRFKKSIDLHFRHVGPRPPRLTAWINDMSVIALLWPMPLASDWISQRCANLLRTMQLAPTQDLPQLQHRQPQVAAYLALLAPWRQDLGASQLLESLDLCVMTELIEDLDDVLPPLQRITATPALFQSLVELAVTIHSSTMGFHDRADSLYCLVIEFEGIKADALALYNNVDNSDPQCTRTLESFEFRLLREWLAPKFTSSDIDRDIAWYATVKAVEAGTMSSLPHLESSRRAIEIWDIDVRARQPAWDVAAVLNAGHTLLGQYPLTDGASIDARHHPSDSDSDSDDGFDLVHADAMQVLAWNLKCLTEVAGCPVFEFANVSPAQLCTRLQALRERHPGMGGPSEPEGVAELIGLALAYVARRLLKQRRELLALCIRFVPITTANATPNVAELGDFFMDLLATAEIAEFKSGRRDLNIDDAVAIDIANGRATENLAFACKRLAAYRNEIDDLQRVYLDNVCRWADPDDDAYLGADLIEGAWNGHVKAELLHSMCDNALNLGPREGGRPDIGTPGPFCIWPKLVEYMDLRLLPRKLNIRFKGKVVRLRHDQVLVMHVAPWSSDVEPSDLAVEVRLWQRRQGSTAPAFDSRRSNARINTRHWFDTRVSFGAVVIPRGSDI